jgi:hypothetical protein
MKRKIAFSILVLILVSCSALRTEAPAQGSDLEDPGITATMTYLTQDIDIGDGGLLSGRPCPSPCAFGVRIGETQLDQVIPVLESNGISRCWTEPNLSWSQISCGGTRLNVQVTMDTRLVSAIWFHPSVPVSLGDIIEKYGEPNYVTLDQEVARQLHPKLYWNSLRMLVVVPDVFSEFFDAGNTTQAEEISFSDENIYRFADKEANPNFQPWDGYGMYQPIVPFPLNPTPMATATP